MDRDKRTHQTVGAPPELTLGFIKLEANVRADAPRKWADSSSLGKDLPSEDRDREQYWNPVPVNTVSKNRYLPKLQGPHAEDAMAAVPRAANFGDLITADHKVLSDNCESRNNHRYAVVVQDQGTQWIQAYPCKTKTSQETQRSLQKFLEPERKPIVIYTDNSLEFGKACEDLSWNHCTSTPHRSETNGIA